MLAFINMPAVNGEVYITSPDRGISLNHQQQNKINHLLTCHIYKMKNIDFFSDLNIKVQEIECCSKQ